MRTVRAALLATGLTLVLAGSAAAAPFTISSGLRPRLAVDAAGTAYVAWTEAVTNTGTGGDDTTHFCKVPRGASACAAGSERTFTVNPGPSGDDDGATGPAVFLDGANVNVWFERENTATGDPQSYVATSPDGGASFSTPIVLGANRTFDDGDVVALPSGAIAVLDSIDTFGDRFQRQPFAGPAPAVADKANLGGDGPNPAYDGASALASIGTAAKDDLIAVMATTSSSHNLAFRTFGSPGTPDQGSNTIANWSGLRIIGTGNSPRLCTGAGGTSLLSVGGSPGANVLEVRNYDTATGFFSTPATIDSRSQIDRFGCARDAAGHLIVVYWTGSTQRFWSSARPTQTADLNTETPGRASSVGVASDGGGWVTYENAGSVRLQPLSEAVYPGTTPPSNPPSNPPSEPPLTGDPIFPLGPGSTHVTQAPPLVDGGIGVQVGLKLPNKCVPTPKRFYATLTKKVIKVLRGKRLPNRGEFRAIQVDFRVDRKLFFRDKHGPSFRALITTRARKAGKHSISAVVTLRQRRLIKGKDGKFHIKITKKLFKRTVNGAFRIC